MADLTRLVGDHSWFAALPDCAAAAAAAQSFTGRARRVVPHPSGRPWIVGQWADADLTVVSAGPARLAVVGSFGGTSDELTRIAAQAATRPVPELCRAVGRLPGCFHVIGVAAGQVFVRGTASGLRRVFHTRLRGVTVASDRAGLLAEAGETSLDEAIVTATMLAPAVPHPLDVASLWRGVTAVAPDHCVVVRDDDHGQAVRWWTAPPPDMSLAEGASALREALRSAVGVRTRAGGTVSADLSGGVDSTALCFLAAGREADVITLRVAPLDPGSSDPEWADRAAASLGAEHVVVDPTDAYSAADATHTGDADSEEPVGGLLTHAVVSHTARLLAGRGSRVHLAGYGGDEVVGVSRAYVRDLLLRRPGVALKHLRAHRRLRRWSLVDTLRALTDTRSYPDWQRAAAAAVHRPRPSGAVPQFGWGAATHVPPWVTAAAVTSLRDRMVATAAGATPLAPQRAQHRAVATIWSASQAARQVGRVMAVAGLPLATPLLDDTVVTAALAVDLAERGTPWRYKPLLTEAMRPVLPAELAGRRTKGVFAAEGIAGVRRYRTTLLDLCDDSELARMGLVDADALRAACLTLDPTGHTVMAVENTMAVELWLRASAERTGKVTP